MLFSSLVFLSIFLPVVTLLYFTVKHELRNYVLLVASLIFMHGENQGILLLCWW